MSGDGCAVNQEALLRLPEVARRVGLGRSTIDRMIRAGRFPRPRRIGQSAVAWLQSEIVAWMVERPAVGTQSGTPGRPDGAHGERPAA